MDELEQYSRARLSDEKLTIELTNITIEFARPFDC